MFLSSVCFSGNITVFVRSLNIVFSHDSQEEQITGRKNYSFGVCTQIQQGYQEWEKEQVYIDLQRSYQCLYLFFYFLTAAKLQTRQF